MRIKNIVIVVMIVLIAAFAPSLVQAQDPSIPNPGGDADVPIDGGLSLLLAAGIGYVAKRGYDKKKKNNDVLEK